MKLYYNPLSSYSQKVLTAFYEKEVQFTPQIVNVMDPGARAEYTKLSPFGKVPLLVLDDGRKLIESSIIIEYLEDHHRSGAQLISDDKDTAREARYVDRFFDLYINDPMAKIFFDGMKPEPERDPRGVAAAKTTMDRAYVLADEMFASRTWAAGDSFSIGDCSAAPALAYARMVYPFEQFKNLIAYSNRLNERPSFARVRTEAAPFMAQFNKS